MGGHLQPPGTALDLKVAMPGWFDTGWQQVHEDMLRGSRCDVRNTHAEVVVPGLGKKRGEQIFDINDACHVAAQLFIQAALVKSPDRNEDQGGLALAAYQTDLFGSDGPAIVTSELHGLTSRFFKGVVEPHGRTTRGQWLREHYGVVLRTLTCRLQLSVPIQFADTEAGKPCSSHTGFEFATLSPAYARSPVH
ncbi:hypothetical protein D3C78_536290 [compost metagenome]